MNSETKNTPSWKHIINNNFYILKIIFKIVPELCFLLPIRIIVYSVIQFITNTWLLQYIINGFQDGMDFKKIILIVLFIYLFGFGIKQLFAYYENVHAPKIYLRLEEYIQKRIFEKNTSVEYACYEDKVFYDKYVKASGDLYNRVMGVLQSMLSFFHVVITLSMYSFFVLSIDPYLVLFIILPVIISFLLEKKKNIVQHEYNMKSQEENRQSGYTSRSFYLADFAKEMRLTNIYKVMLERFENSAQNIIAYIRHYGLKLATIDYIINESKEVFSCMGAMLYAVYQTLVSGSMQYGDCLVVINSVQALIYTIINVSNAIMAFHRNSLYIDTIREYLDYEPKIKDGELDAPESGELHIDNIRFRYDGSDKDVLRDVSLTIRPGEKIALVGHNGAGKSTLVKLLLRLYDPTHGTISYAGKNIKSYKLAGYRERFGVVFQDVRLFAMSVKDNVVLRRARYGDEKCVEQALTDSGCIEKIRSFEKGIDAVLTREFDDDGKILSGGEGQKIAIARAFAKENSILLLDEPSSALDPIAEYRMYETLMKACAGKSVVFISHRLASAVLADRVILLEDGEIVEEGSHSELIKKNGKYAELFRIQAQNYVTEEVVV